MKPSGASVPTLSQLNIYLYGGNSYTCQRRWNSIHEGREDQGGPYTAPGGTLPVEMVVQAISEGLALGIRSVRLTGISNGGGDPMNYPEFDRLLDLLKISGAALKIETDGTQLQSDRARRLAQYAHCQVRIALAGADAATHDGLTGVAGGFVSATNAARLLVDEGLAPDLLFPVVRRNAGQIKSIIRLAEQLGAGSLSFIAVSPFHQQANGGCRRGGSGNKFEQLTVEELIALGRKVERQYQSQTRIKL